jgi:histidinol-phosphatase (PHP family)
MEEYIENAMARGIREYGFSEHSHWMIQAPGEWLAMKESDLDHYVESVRGLQRRYNREGAQPFHLRLGLEMDFVPTRLATARAVSEKYDWDYRIGSVHHIGVWGFDNPALVKQWDEYHLEDICEAYFGLVRQMIEERFCETIGHLDLVKKFGHRPEGGFTKWIEPLIPLIKQAGMAVEINTAGRDKPAKEFYPSWDIVERLIEAKIPITLGADAHAPDEAARYIDEAVAGLRQRGVKTIVRFEKRRMAEVEI